MSTIDNTPSVLSSAHLLALNDNGLLGAHDGERNDVLDLGVERALLLVELIVVVGVHLQVVEGELLLNSLLECGALLHGQGV